jgi:peroxiredoxin
MHNMPARRRHLITFAAFSALAAAGVFTASQATAEEKAQPGANAVIGQPAPAFELKDQDGKIVSLADYKNQVVVLEWFNDGCPFVQKWYKSGDMNAIAANYSAKGVVWLAINSTSSANVEHNKTAAAKFGILRPVLDDADGKVGRLYGAKTTPQMFVVDKGTLVYNGAIDSIKSPDQEDIAKADNYVKAALDEVLAGKPVSKPTTLSYGCSVKYK